MTSFESLDMPETEQYDRAEYLARSRQLAVDMIAARRFGTSRLFRGIRTGDGVNETGLHDGELETYYAGHPSPREISLGAIAAQELPSYDDIATQHLEDPYTGARLTD